MADCKEYPYEDFQEGFARLRNFVQHFPYADATEREIAIVGPAYLDELMKDMLMQFFVEDQKTPTKLLQGAIQNFGTRADLLFCLGLVPKTIHDDLLLLAKIRNEFAHNIDATFDLPKVSGFCVSLKWHHTTLGIPPAEATARDLFQVGLNQIVCYLGGAISIARGEKRKMPLE